MTKRSRPGGSILATALARLAVFSAPARAAESAGARRERIATAGGGEPGLGIRLACYGATFHNVKPNTGATR